MYLNKLSIYLGKYDIFHRLFMFVHSDTDFWNIHDILRPRFICFVILGCISNTHSL